MRSKDRCGAALGAGTSEDRMVPALELAERGEPIISFRMPRRTEGCSGKTFHAARTKPGYRRQLHARPAHACCRRVLKRKLRIVRKYGPPLSIPLPHHARTPIRPHPTHLPPLSSSLSSLPLFPLRFRPPTLSSGAANPVGGACGTQEAAELGIGDVTGAVVSRQRRSKPGPAQGRNAVDRNGSRWNHPAEDDFGERYRGADVMCRRLIPARRSCFGRVPIRHVPGADEHEYRLRPMTILAEDRARHRGRPLLECTASVTAAARWPKEGRA